MGHSTLFQKKKKTDSTHNTSPKDITAKVKKGGDMEDEKRKRSTSQATLGDAKIFEEDSVDGPAGDLEFLGELSGRDSPVLHIRNDFYFTNFQKMFLCLAKCGNPISREYGQHAY
jgi:hypothetical protein